jgi:hypothetical protein
VRNDGYKRGYHGRLGVAYYALRPSKPRFDGLDVGLRGFVLY